MMIMLTKKLMMLTMTLMLLMLHVMTVMVMLMMNLVLTMTLMMKLMILMIIMMLMKFQLTLTTLKRLATKQRVYSWGIYYDPVCQFCSSKTGTLGRLCLSCSYSQVREHVQSKRLVFRISTEWESKFQWMISHFFQDNLHKSGI